MKIDSVTLWRVRVPLLTPYNTALGAPIEAFDSIVGEIRDTDGRIGIGESTIVPGYTHETSDAGWAFCRAHGEAIVGLDTVAAKARFDPHRASDPHAVSVLQVAIEGIEGNPVLAAPDVPVRVPILTPVNSKDLDVIPDEIEQHIAKGFGTLKVKVGWDVDKDLKRVALIQEVNAGRARLRLDANQGFSEADGGRFAQNLDPDSIELFEQPCDSGDWDANGAVAKVSTVPVMMDESIYGVADIDRAAAMEGCGFVKLKISKLTGVDMLADGLRRVRELGLTPVLGNGAAPDIGCWVEACVARTTIDNAGEMCGFLKNREQLLETPITFDAGDIVLQPGYAPRLNRELVERLAVDKVRFAGTTVAAK
jgi:L-alanine-DL-glutamate epimerase-like enolase superfamily enzyme